jgi:Bacteriocin-protection, YdeI or OmpD-Associated
MTPLFKKLNFKAPGELWIINAPASFDAEIKAMSENYTVYHEFSEPLSFALTFATKQAEVDAIAHEFAQKTKGDTILWISYPKGSSKKYTCDFNRDTGWGVLGELGFEPVRQVAIDEDWSALRFRRVDYIKTMTRSFAMTKAGQEKVNAANLAAVAPTLPDDFEAELLATPAALAFFQQLAPSHQKEYIRWIEDAKKLETRASRVKKALEMLQNGKKIS